MLTMLQTMNGWGEGWLKVMIAFLWQSALLVALAALIAWCLRRSSPVVRYWLWQIVIIKLLLMPFWSLAVPMPTWAGITPPSQPATSQPPAAPPPAARPPEDLADGPSRPVLAHPPQTPRREGTQSASQSPSLGDLWATLSWRAWLLSAWLAIIVWQVLRLLRQRAWLARLLRRAAAAEGELAQLVAELAESIGLRRPPTALCVAGHCPLFVCGLLRPRLVMPSGLMSSLGPAERRQVILHELAHLKRRDLLWGWTAEIAQVVYFFHPLVWWAGYRLRLERELACDQLAMARSGHPPADYAQTLVQVVSHASEPAGVQAAAISAELTGGQSPAKGD
jgi:beta-lactamase regulating signal transducer with metallopeptidase domain